MVRLRGVYSRRVEHHVCALMWWSTKTLWVDEMAKLIKDISLRGQRHDRDMELRLGAIAAAISANGKLLAKLCEHEMSEEHVLETIQTSLVTERMLMLDRIETLHREVLRLTSVATGVPDRDVITEKLEEIRHNVNSEYTKMRERVDALHAETVVLHTEAKRLALEKQSQP